MSPKNGQNGPKSDQEQCFLRFLKVFIISFPWKQSNMKNHIVISISLQTFFLTEFLFSGYGLKFLQPIRLQKREGSEEEKNPVDVLHVGNIKDSIR